MKQTQKQVVLALLKDGHTLTKYWARSKCIYSLSSVVSKLRKDGHKIDATRSDCGVIKYKLDTNQPYEREFFNFLKERGMLDEYIAEVQKRNWGKFRLTQWPETWLALPFTWMFSKLGFDSWAEASQDWRRLLFKLKTQPTR